MSAIRTLYTIPVVWEMRGYQKVMAQDIEEAKDRVLAAPHPLPEGKYVKDSIQIDEEHQIDSEEIEENE